MRESEITGRRKVRGKPGRMSRAEQRPDNLVFAYNLIQEREKVCPGHGGAKTFAEDVLGIGRNSYYPWESGVRTNPSADNIKMLCEKLNTTREALYKPPENWDTIKWEFYRKLFPEEYALVEEGRAKALAVEEQAAAAAAAEQTATVTVPEQATTSNETQNTLNMLAHKQLGGVLDVLSLFSDAAKKLPPTQFETLLKEVTTYIKIKSTQENA